jgi:hypothetical protein
MLIGLQIILSKEVIAIKQDIIVYYSRKLRIVFAHTIPGPKKYLLSWIRLGRE